MHFDRLHRRRFTEYSEAFEATSSLQDLGTVAWLRIVGSHEPSDRMTMLLAVRATAKLRALQGLGRPYTVIGPITARLRPPHGGGDDTQRVL
jgi:hypothetical protein